MHPKRAIADLEAHLGTRHTDIECSALKLDEITRQILNYHILFESFSKEEANHALGLYQRAMECVLGYIDLQGQRKLLVGALRNINIRYVNLTRLRDRLPLLMESKIDCSDKSIRANIAQ